MRTFIATSALGLVSVLGCSSSSNPSLTTPDDGGAVDGDKQTEPNGKAEAAAGGGIDRSGFDQNVCENGWYRGLANLRPAEPVDYVGERQRDPYSSAAMVARVVDSEGVACRGARDVGACRAAVEALSPLGWPAGGDGSIPLGPYIERSLAYTRGDGVGAIGSLDALRTFLVPLSGVSDAAYLVINTARFAHFDCTRANARVTSSGFEVITQTGYPCGSGSRLDENRVVVSREGEISIVETVFLREGESSCLDGRRASRTNAGGTGHSLR